MKRDKRELKRRFRAMVKEVGEQEVNRRICATFDEFRTGEMRLGRDGNLRPVYTMAPKYRDDPAAADILLQVLAARDDQKRS